jgi:hypothetical protein
VNLLTSHGRVPSISAIKELSKVEDFLSRLKLGGDLLGSGSDRLAKAVARPRFFDRSV